MRKTHIMLENYHKQVPHSLSFGLLMDQPAFLHIHRLKNPITANDFSNHAVVF